jgi:hypothetical protein
MRLANPDNRVFLLSNRELYSAVFNVALREIALFAESRAVNLQRARLDVPARFAF